MNWLFKVTSKRVMIGVAGLLGLLLGTSALLYGVLLIRRPPRTNTAYQLFQGIHYRREARSTPRPLMIHIVTIDLTTPGIQPLVTPGNYQGWDQVWKVSREVPARTTSEFIQEFQLQLGINGSYFAPCIAKTPWEYYPRSGDAVNVMGEAISNGETYSPGEPRWNVLCFSPENRASIQETRCDVGTVQGIAGSEIFLDKKQPVYTQKDFLGRLELYPRTAVAVDQTGTKLWLIIVDGRQPHYSEGVTIPELGQIAQDLGAYRALNLDGGGSTTLVLDKPSGVQALNAPIQTYVPMRQRPIPNHLGFYAQPIKADTISSKRL